MLQVRIILNLLLSKYDRVKVLVFGLLLVPGLKMLIYAIKLLSAPRRIKDMLICILVRIFRKLPRVHAEIEKQKLKARKSIESSVLLLNETKPMEHLPETGLSVKKLLEVLDVKSRSEKANWSNGNLTGAVYNTSDDLAEVHSYALSCFLKANLLHPDIFLHTRQMEAEVIRMCVNLFSGDENACGSVTSGGTESILLSVKAYRDFAKSVRGIYQPNMVVPSTAHAAFTKAADYFGVEIRTCECDPLNYFEVNLAHMQSLIDSNTIMLVGSSPQYPHGTMDPIPAIAKMAAARKIPCHVDACLGSFLLPFLKSQLPYEFDFALFGVTSISCDTHKYGYAPKGTSVLMFRSKEYRKFQYSVCSNWEGGLYATPTISGSRSSAPVVAAWATMMYMGAEQYAECAIKINEGTKKMGNFIAKKIPQLKLLGRTDTSVVSFATTGALNIFDIAEWMRRNTNRKWTLAILQNPPGVHFAVTMANVSNCEEFCHDLLLAVEAETQRGQPGSSDSAAIYGSAASVPKTLVDELVVDYLDTCYMTCRSIA